FWEARHSVSWVTGAGVRMFPFVGRFTPVGRVEAVAVNMGAVGLVADWSVVLVMKERSSGRFGRTPLYMDCYTFGGATRVARRMADVLGVPMRDGEIELPPGRERDTGLPGERVIDEGP
ncbi:hypothetical protein, partial [Propionicicella superfundia]|uniref:hypothetical protein n=1 Tax=Propionicicella superfundia TaxID=348582 RepID=UPI000566D1CA